jgi:PAS domain S-box-containing protein
MSGKDTRGGLFFRCLLAVGASVAALVLRLSMGQTGQELPTYITFYPAVMLVAVVAGFGPGLVATLSSALLADYYVIPPQGSFRIVRASDVIGFVLFLVMGVFISLVAEASRRNRRKAAAYEKELALQASEARYRDLVELSPLAIIIHRENRIRFANPAACLLFGAGSPEQLHRRPWLEFFPLECQGIVSERIQEVAAGKRVPLIEEKILRLDGTVREVEVIGSPVVIDAGPATQVILRDITERKQKEEELRDYREWLRVTLTSIGDAVMACDAAGVITFLNPTAEELTGWKLSEAVGQPIQRVFQVMNELTGAPARDVVAQVLTEQRACALANQTSLTTRDGRVIPIEDSAAPILDAAGAVTGAVLVFHDVTERRRAQNALRQSNAVLKGFSTVLEEALSCETEEELGKTCLKVAEDLTESKFGFVGEIGPDDMLHDIVISDSGWAACKMYNQSGKRRSPGSFKIHGLYGRVLLDGRSLLTNSPGSHPDGIGTPPGHIPLTAFLGVPLQDSGRTIGMIAVANREGGYRLEDQAALETLAPAVSEALRRTRAEQALRSSEARLRLALNSANSGVWEWDVETGRNTWSDELWPLYGLEPNSCEPCYEAWRSTVHPGDRDMAEKAIQQAARGGSDINLEYRVLARGGAVRWLMARGRPHHDADGKPARYVGIVMDITERKRAEAALMQSEKLASVGRVAATIAHEINNPLAAVMNTLYLAQNCEGAPAAVQQYLAIADAELKRVSHITHQALGFYRESSTPAAVEIAAVLDSATDLLESRIKSRGATVEKQCQPGLELTGVSGELRQVFANLLANSLDAIPDHGVIKFRARATTSPKDGSECIRVTLSDNGTGFDAGVRCRIFEALFTTKDATGTGLGLWVSKQIVDKHCGSIRVRSRTGGPRRGTTFSILLPVKSNGAGVAPQPKPSGQASEGHIG